MIIVWSAKARQDLLDIYRTLAPRDAARRTQAVVRAKVGALSETRAR